MVCTSGRCVGQGVADFSSEGPDSKYFPLWGLRGRDSILLLQGHSSRFGRRVNERPSYVPGKLLTREVRLCLVLRAAK